MPSLSTTVILLPSLTNERLVASARELLNLSEVTSKTFSSLNASDSGDLLNPLTLL